MVFTCGMLCLPLTNLTCFILLGLPVTESDITWSELHPSERVYCKVLLLIFEHAVRGMLPKGRKILQLAQTIPVSLRLAHTAVVELVRSLSNLLKLTLSSSLSSPSSSHLEALSSPFLVEALSSQADPLKLRPSQVQTLPSSR
ncbi:hypothetical protein F2Q70_00020250 [Brassica cretica]|uniref:Uncharacterized protein n=1 Tax=Brassica cretica TaxID=69181 RepID=A0A8S9GKC1_BRACR|nr:hypothetical protein F2Q70_00020250 [Brassica cretica]